METQAECCGHFSAGAGMPDMVVIPAGRCEMGARDGEEGQEDCEGPRHVVVIARAFALSRTPVTFAQWDVFLAHAPAAHRPADEGWGRAGRPVVNVSWDDAQAYVRWLAARCGRPCRLPSESEWEYAARAGTQTAYHWGEPFEAGRANGIDSGCEWSGTCSSPVGSFAANAFGLHDMHGNVWEWVEDCWNEFYLDAPDDGSPWRAGRCDARVLRGGSWCDPPRLLRAAARNRNSRGFRCNDYGFRVALSL
ncbi:formylglycine-generating enzyme family protein [Vineibacter terrae]|uniref:Formylglycine-generating enzyme family protein n=1 Tax=Vineibacter terrae TaxID=2586908 RepID=A0A5C8PH13_9HYPH|nr:formylglycine-generating enzyme family protein [Vineibacter terrae]TXL72920.1 formylglycine-generating enzyme family protein [Vineibacter terrae]